METTAFSNKPFLFTRNSQFPSKSVQLHPHNVPGMPKLSRAVKLASKKDTHDGDFSGAMVDNDMFMLQRRIHEMETIEAKREAQQCWMEWERECYDKYHSGVCSFVGLVQILLMNSRPSVAVAMLVFFMASLPASVIMVLLSVQIS